MTLRDDVTIAGLSPVFGDETAQDRAFFRGSSGKGLASAIQRRRQIQRAVNFIAVVLFGALGALAGVTLVILMLVALVIPTTTSIVVASLAISFLVFAAAIWLKRRALSARAANDALPADQFAGIAA